ncbi:MAG: DUF4838 domain-containing protein [Armatimonadetes bacterium]|nr:DUF4838 domain-containing protein [Candidatus Hippobium faecium]
MKYLFFVIGIILFSCEIFAFDIVKDGKPAATIVLGKNPDTITEYAVGELNKYVKLISGVSLPVSQKPVKGNNIYIGMTEESEKFLKGFDRKSLKNDGIIIKCNENRLVLLGENSGTIYAVYELLERFFGVKFLTEDDEYIPSLKTMTVGKTDIAYNPPFMVREVYYHRQFINADYNLKTKINGQHQPIPAELGGHYGILGFVHTFDQVLNSEEYGTEHPEWFSERGGKRIKGYMQSQICLTNEEVIGVLTEKYLNWIAENPDMKIVSVSQNDNMNPCECEKCKALTEKYGHSGALLTVVNRIADAIGEKYPDKYVETLAYNYTREAPKGGIVPRDNVIIRLCDIECNFNKPLNDESNRDFAKDLEEWSKVTKQLYIWDYVVNFSNLIILYPNFNVLQDNVRIMRDHNAVAVFEQGDGFNDNACLGNYKRYILTKLLWNPELDMAKETESFMKAYYGPASEDMLGFLNYINETMKTKDVFMRLATDNSYFTAEDWIKCFSFLKSAYKKAENTDYFDKVKTDLVCFHAGFLSAPAEISKKVYDADVLVWRDSEEVLKLITEYLSAQRVGYIGEGRPMSESPYANPVDWTKKGEKPDICKDLSDTDWLDFHGKDIIKVCGDDTFGSVVSDNASVLGDVRWLNSAFVDWSCQQPFGSVLFDKSIKGGDIYVTYRCEGEGDVGRFAIYDGTDKNFCNYTFTGEDTPDGNYKTVKIGSVDFASLSNSSYMYFCGSGDRGGKLFIERLFIVLDRE